VDDDDILFEQEWPRHRLREELTNLGMSDFACQMLNDPVPAGLAEIKPDWIESAWASPPDNLELTNYGGFDPRGGGVCEAADAVVGVDKDGVIWVRAVDGGLWDVHASRAEFLKMLREWSPYCTTVEVIGVGAAFEQLFQEDLDEESKKTGIFYWAEYIKSWGNNLEDMVRTVFIPRLQAGKIKLAPALKGTPLFDQLLRFPKSARKDRLAALTMAVYTAAQYGHNSMGQAAMEPVAQEMSREERRAMGYSDDGVRTRVGRETQFHPV
jgi:hypothetical protein